MEVRDQAAVVTGGASGLGRATVYALAKSGAKVAALDVQKHQLDQVASQTGGLGIECDVSDDDSVVWALDVAQKAHGVARIIVNCAGVSGDMRFVNRSGPVDMQAYRRVFDINVMGTVSVMSKSISRMINEPVLGDDGERGVVVNTSSITAYEGQIGQAAYAASKGAVAAITLPAAREFAFWGVRVVSIAPGLFETPMSTEVPERVSASFREKPLFPKRFGKPKEFAELVIGICKNPMFNGETIRLDAGVRLEPR